MTTLKINIKNSKTLQKVLKLLSQFEDVEIERNNSPYNERILKAKEKAEKGEVVSFTSDSFDKFSQKILDGENIDIAKVIKDKKYE